MGLLYGRAGRLTAKNGGFRPGQSRAEIQAGRYMHNTEVRHLVIQGWVVVFVASYFSSTDVSMSFVQLAITIARCYDSTKFTPYVREPAPCHGGALHAQHRGPPSRHTYSICLVRKRACSVPWWRATCTTPRSAAGSGLGPSGVRRSVLVVSVWSSNFRKTAPDN
jgi:hypothetical protein